MELNGYRENETKRMNRAKAVANGEGKGKSGGQLGSSVYLIAPHVGPFRLPKGKKKEKNRKGGNNN